jgi:hypothetical protein
MTEYCAIFNRKLNGLLFSRPIFIYVRFIDSIIRAVTQYCAIFNRKLNGLLFSRPIFIYVRFIDSIMRKNAVTPEYIYI